MSITRLARELSVSTATVSLALSGSTEVSEQTRQRVIKAAERTGYVPNRQAQALRTRRSRLIGLIIPGLDNPIYVERVASAQRAAAEHGYEVTFAYSDWSVSQERAICRNFLGLGVEGVIVEGSASPLADADNPENPFRPFLQQGIPLLHFSDTTYSVARNISSIQINRAGGIYAAMRHLLDLGHRSFGFLGIVAHSPGKRAHPRMVGIERALAEFGEPVQTEFLFPAHNTLDGYQLINDRLNRGTALPTALLTLNDQIAIGAMRAVFDHGLSVPEDLSVIGFDNVQMSAFCRPRLTTVSQTHQDMGGVGVNMVINQIERGHPPSHQQLDLELIVRESTGPPVRKRR